jgi:hypothetical protein
MVAGARNHLNLLFNAPHLRHSDSVVGSQPFPGDGLFAHWRAE